MLLGGRVTVDYMEHARMTYRKRTTYSQKLKNMREAKERKRMESEPPDYPHELPDLRRRIIIIDYDFGEVVHVIEMHKTNRIDQYRVVADGKEWKRRAGWSKVLEGLRKSFMRVHSSF